MTNYTKTTDFAAKDALPSGNAAKIVKGSEIDAEFNNIATSSATKANANAAALTGTTTFETISDGTIAITAFVDEDDMTSDSATLLPTQQSVKAYVDSQVTAQDLDVTDGSTSIDIDLDSESLGILGGTGIDSTASGTGVTLAIDSTVATLTGTQTLSNKTLSAPVVSGNLTTDGLVDGRDVATDGTKLDGIESGATADQTAAEIKTAYESNADTNAFTDADHTKLDGIEASADVTDTTNVTAAGALMDSEVTNLAQVKAFDSSDYATAAQGTTADSALQDGDTVASLDINGGTIDGTVIGGSTTAAGSFTTLQADTSLNVDGTVTAAGLTVDTNTLVVDATNNRVGIGTSSPSTKLTVFGTGVGNATVQIEGEGGADPFINFLANNTQHWSLGIDDSDADKFKISEHSALGTNDYFVVDVTGNVGIGMSPTTNSISKSISLVNGGSIFGYGASTYITGNSNYNGAWNTVATGPDSRILLDGNVVFSRSSSASAGSQGTVSESMRIDASGNLLVGTTDTAPGAGDTNEGFSINSSRVFVSRASDYSLSLNRTTDDGPIALFRKDGTTVGSIAVASSNNLAIDGLVASHAGLEFGTGRITPRVAGATADNAVDLGYSTQRFQDLYLSGGAYLGGTAAANKLDDYEEGTWTPIVRGSGTQGSYTYLNGYGVYTKVGRQVTISFFLENITQVTAGTGYLQIHGCPFTKAGSQFFTGAASLQSIDWSNSNTYGTLQFTTSSATSTLYIRLNGDNYTGSDLQISELVSGSSDIGGTITFFNE